MKRYSISIVLLSKNAETVINDTLNTIFQQEINVDFEVIVIDSGSKDNTINIIKEFNEVKLVEISPGDFGHGKTRLMGANLARGEIIVFLNADATPTDKYWLKNLISVLLKNNKIAGAFSRQLPRKNCNPLKMRELLEGTPFRLLSEMRIVFLDDINEIKPNDIKKKRDLLSFETISCAIRKSILHKFPFDDVLYGEDFFWSKKVLENHFGIAYVPQSAVFHSHNYFNSFFQTMRIYIDIADLSINTVGKTFEVSSSASLNNALEIFYLDLIFIKKLNKSIPYKLFWAVYCPFIRASQLIGTLIGYNKDMLPKKLIDKLSLTKAKMK